MFFNFWYLYILVNLPLHLRLLFRVFKLKLLIRFINLLPFGVNLGSPLVITCSSFPIFALKSPNQVREYDFDYLLHIGIYVFL